MTDPFVVIGGDAAGLSAASKAKREDPEREVIVFEKGEWVSYAACGMPYYIKGEIDSLDDLVQLTAEEIRTDRDIDLRTQHEVVEIDPEERTVTVESATDQFTQPYEELLLATGAQAIEPPFPGLSRDGVFTIHDMDSAGAIKQYLEAETVERAAIVGGGYVGIEMAEALRERDIEVDLYEMLPHVLQPFGTAVAEAVEDELEKNDVSVHLDTAVDGFEGDSAVETISTESGTAPADLVILGVGVEPNTDLAESAGIETGKTGAIAVDEYGRTNVDTVFAAGDCAEATHAVSGEPDHVPLALTANRAGRAIGQTVTGDPTPVGEIAGTAIVKAFDLGAARTGILDETRAREAGFEPVSVTIDAPSRAHYYPGSKQLTVTLVADEESGRVIGASLVGSEGVKRIDTVATALHAGHTVEELQNLDLAYAPPYSPVWDPVLTAARVLSGKL